MCLICTHYASNASNKYHVPKNIACTVNSVAKARSAANGMSWEEFKDKWRRRLSNPYQFFAVSIHIEYILTTYACCYESCLFQALLPAKTPTKESDSGVATGSKTSLADEHGPGNELDEAEVCTFPRDKRTLKVSFMHI